MSLKDDVLIVGAGIIVALAAAWYAKKKLDGVIVGAKDLASDAADYVMDRAEIVTNTLVVTPIEAIGAVVGIPKTNPTACQKAMAEGRTWDASFACPASDFLKYLAR